jgi:hypothetical protein
MEIQMNRVRVASTALLFLVVGGAATARAQDPRDRHPQPPPQRVSPEEQHQRVQQQQQRATQYRQHLDQQVHVIQQQNTQLQQQKRTAQYQAQQEYAARLQQQQQRLQTTRNYTTDPYINTPASYRYTFGGVAHQTNQYGADVLRQAVNNGYQQGLRAGAADRQDHWASNYSNSIAYRDANYGYEGNYVDQTDYNYYFRQGFQRGYTDGYNQRTQYGTSANGTSSILGNVLSSILGLVSIH